MVFGRLGASKWFNCHGTSRHGEPRYLLRSTPTRAGGPAQRNHPNTPDQKSKAGRTLERPRKGGLGVLERPTAFGLLAATPPRTARSICALRLVREWGALVDPWPFFTGRRLRRPRARREASSSVAQSNEAGRGSHNTELNNAIRSAQPILAPRHSHRRRATIHASRESRDVSVVHIHQNPAPTRTPLSIFLAWTLSSCLV